MSSTNRRKSQPKQSLREAIEGYLSKKGLIIQLDMKGDSQEGRMDLPYSYSDKTRTLHIVAPVMASKDEELLNEIIRRVFDDGGLILKTNTRETLESYQEYAAQNNDTKILEFFASILSREDYSALRMSLYLRYAKSKGRNVHRLKQDIRDKYGDRGANIANLCSADYFEKDFMPLYNQVTKEEFYQYYELAVGIKAKALFVHSGMSLHEIEEEFFIILSKAIKYHIKEFTIHGLGPTNVEIIKQFVAAHSSPEEERFVIKKGKESVTPLAIQYIVTIYPEGSR